HPVTFGHCGYPGLCVRGTARALCLGCPFWRADPSSSSASSSCSTVTVKAADAHERMGDLAGARERHRTVAELRQLRQEMLLMGEHSDRELDSELEAIGSWHADSRGTS